MTDIALCIHVSIITKDNGKKTFSNRYVFSKQFQTCIILRNIAVLQRDLYVTEKLWNEIIHNCSFGIAIPKVPRICNQCDLCAI